MMVNGAKPIDSNTMKLAYEELPVTPELFEAHANQHPVPSNSFAWTILMVMKNIFAFDEEKTMSRDRVQLSVKFCVAARHLLKTLNAAHLSGSFSLTTADDYQSVFDKQSKSVFDARGAKNKPQSKTRINKLSLLTDSNKICVIYTEFNIMANNI